MKTINLENWREEIKPIVEMIARATMNYINGNIDREGREKVYDDAVLKIQSLLTSVQQAEREKMLKKLPKKYKVEGSKSQQDQIWGINYGIQLCNKAIQSLTEEDGKETGK